jgi:hypothetical protein
MDDPLLYQKLDEHRRTATWVVAKTWVVGWWRTGDSIVAYVHQVENV